MGVLVVLLADSFPLLLCLPQDLDLPLLLVVFVVRGGPLLVVVGRGSREPDSGRPQPGGFSCISFPRKN